mmetsp:Transcript_75422/g.191379  ORF Transcript_75422/g.191379 Transcript_75422/m.191379 type:complete len:246 (-) Transcript_75422:652-1389(-)
MVHHQAIRDGLRASRTRAPELPGVVPGGDVNRLQENRQRRGRGGSCEGVLTVQRVRAVHLRDRPGLVGRVVAVARRDAVADTAEEHTQKNDVGIVGIAGMPVPSVQRRRVKGQRDQRPLLVAGQGLEEGGVRRQLRLPLFPEGHFSQELVLCPRLEFTTPLKLALVEVPNVREAIGSSLQILFHGTEDADFEAVAVHLVPVLHGVREGPGRDEVHADLAEDLEAIDLGVRGAAVGEVADERDVDG